MFKSSHVNRSNLYQSAKNKERKQPNRGELLKKRPNRRHEITPSFVQTTRYTFSKIVMRRTQTLYVYVCICSFLRYYCTTKYRVIYIR